jgi:hypothetical protein
VYSLLVPKFLNKAVTFVLFSVCCAVDILMLIAWPERMCVIVIKRMTAVKTFIISDECHTLGSHLYITFVVMIRYHTFKYVTNPVKCNTIMPRTNTCEIAERSRQRRLRRIRSEAAYCYICVYFPYGLKSAVT